MAAALVATALVHLPMLGTMRPLMFFGWIVALVTTIAVVFPFSTTAVLDAKIATAIVNLAIGLAAGMLSGGRSGPFGGRSGPFGGRSGPFGGRSGPFGGRSGPFGGWKKRTGRDGSDYVLGLTGRARVVGPGRHSRRGGCWRLVLWPGAA
jgi:hypothetical protein